jgi:hypothetical protein
MTKALKRCPGGHDLSGYTLGSGNAGTFPGRDGLELAYRWTGEGRPLVLLHGFSGSVLQFLQHGPAAALASHGYRVIVPDLRGHGDSARPHDPAAYPPDVLADDGLALVDFLQLRDYDLGGRRDPDGATLTGHSRHHPFKMKSRSIPNGAVASLSRSAIPAGRVVRSAEVLGERCHRVTRWPGRCGPGSVPE